MLSMLKKALVAAFVIPALCLMPPAAIAQGTGPGPGPGPGAANLTTFVTDDFSGSGVCASCHGGLTDIVGNDVSNDALWRSTMMANAAKDPLWQAKISSEVDRAPHLQLVIEEKCSRCHMGMARYQALTDQTDVGVLDSGFLDPEHYLHEAAMDGVSCTLCHQIQSDNLGDPASFTGAYVIDTGTNPPDRQIFGPYSENLFATPMRDASGFNPVFGAQIEDPAHCGTCHTLFTPTLDANGNVVGEFPEQTTYLEWEHSSIAKTCQGCHLPQAVGGVKISNRPPWLAPREPFWQHHFVGGNSYMVGLLRDYAGDLGVTADSVQLQATIDRTDALLATKTAELTVEPFRSGGLLTVTVDVVNHTGHKLPSGLPSRRAWLHLLVTRADGAVVFESGRETGDGRIDGNASDDDFLEWEPHYDTITSADQVQIYEPIMLNTDGEVTHTLLRADSYAKDNRLLPAGFDKDTAEPDIAVHGVPADEDNFQGGSDRIVYVIDISEVSGALDVMVELLFQSVSHPFVSDLEDTETEFVQRFLDMYDPAANTAVALDQVQQRVD